MKHFVAGCKEVLYLVAFLVDAWIETVDDYNPLDYNYVAFLVDAWIETSMRMEPSQ